MDLGETFKTDPTRIKILNKILDAYDNAVISHRLDESQNVIAVYDKYSNIEINKLIRELRQYEYDKFDVRGGIYPTGIVINGRMYEDVVKLEKYFKFDHSSLESLEKALKEALENEDFEKCEMLQNKINKLKK